MINNVPAEVVQRLRQHAERHHRSLQCELLAIIEEAVRPELELTPAELLDAVRGLGLRTPGDAASIIRADRDRHDVRSPAFWSEAHRQSASVAASVHAQEDQAFIDAVTDWSE